MIISPFPQISSLFSLYNAALFLIWNCEQRNQIFALESKEIRELF